MTEKVHAASFTRTLRLKVQRDAYAWLNAAAVEVNQVWNWCNATSIDASDRNRRSETGWGMLRQMLQYKGEHAGRTVQIVSERNTSAACSSCGHLSGSHGVNGLVVRSWICSECGDSHDRDVNAARLILLRGEVSPSVRGNESLPLRVPPSSASRVREAGIETAKAAA